MQNEWMKGRDSGPRVGALNWAGKCCVGVCLSWMSVAFLIRRLHTTAERKVASPLEREPRAGSQGSPGICSINRAVWEFEDVCSKHPSRDWQDLLKQHAVFYERLASTQIHLNRQSSIHPNLGWLLRIKHYHLSPNSPVFSWNGHFFLAHSFRA